MSQFPPTSSDEEDPSIETQTQTQTQTQTPQKTNAELEELILDMRTPANKELVGYYNQFRSQNGDATPAMKERLDTAMSNVITAHNVPFEPPSGPCLPSLPTVLPHSSSDAGANRSGFQQRSILSSETLESIIMKGVDTGSKILMLACETWAAHYKADAENAASRGNMWNNIWEKTFTTDSNPLMMIVCKAAATLITRNYGQ